MNLILFEASELDHPLASDDPRARHVMDVLRRQPGETFDCGLLDGPRGRAAITRIDEAGLHLSFTWGAPPPPLDPIQLLVGIPRPQTARKILGEMATLGVATLGFFPAEKSERSYASSTLWTSGEAHRLLLAGTAQAFCTRIPECSIFRDLDDAIFRMPVPVQTRLALDNYEAVAPLSRCAFGGVPVALAIGSERGWSSRERDILRTHGFTLTHLGPRVLRTETACVAGVTLLKARAGLL